MKVRFCLLKGNFNKTEDFARVQRALNGKNHGASKLDILANKMSLNKISKIVRRLTYI